MENQPLEDVKIEIVTNDISLLGTPGIMVEVDPQTAEEMGASYTPEDELKVMFEEGEEE
ncbi:hypothetical protein WH285_16795 [Acinetobacter johnsonii]|uniref:hypothetical protein n=1 Tax=Acinetobacter johnsonii TaxID=40214 RepID=UPI0030A3A79E